MDGARVIRVLVVDDTSTARRILTKGLNQDHRIEVVGSAVDARDAWRMIQALRPDVITLDVHMPGMSGLEFLKKLRPRYPAPVIMVSGVEDADITLRSLAAGAVDFVAKPHSRTGVVAMLEELRLKVRAVAHARRGGPPQLHSATGVPISTGSVPNAKDRLIALGASTGGTEALEVVLRGLPKDCPGVVLVQHMPPGFTLRFAKRLNEKLPLHVREAQGGERVEPGTVYVGKAGEQLKIVKRGDSLVTQSIVAPKVSGHVPSVDVLFSSIAEIAAPRTAAALLTGMGRDGARGMKLMRGAGAGTIAQDEASCVVYGMPRVAVELGGADHVLPLDQVAAKLIKLSQ